MKTYPSVVIRRYIEEEAGGMSEVDGFCEVEQNEDEVDVQISPRTEDVVTFSMSPQQAWHFARELMRAATLAEHDDAD